MTTTDYVINIALVAIVLRQIRGEILTLRSLLLPLALIAGTAFYYLRTFPTAGNDLALVVVLGLAGAVIGALCGLTTHLALRTDGVFARAGVAAAALWIAGMAARMGFAFAADHGYGQDIANFSRENDITGSAAWIAAFVTMALAQAVLRIAVVRVRAARVEAARGAVAGADQWAASAG